MAVSLPGTVSGKRERALPWVEKYRPKTVTDISHQTEVVATLQNTIATGQLPHLLFYGPPGTGKTSTILAVARDLWGPDLYKSRVRELNASDERGISVVRDSIKTFAQQAVSTSTASRADGYPCPPFKLIILDEADSMTRDAQTALRRTMEAYTKTTRFCILCNYVSRIIEPLASRCAKFRFTPLTPETVTSRVEFIAGAESIQLANGASEALVTLSGGDLRKAITYMQSSARLHGPEVTPETLADVAGTVPNEVIEQLYAALHNNSFGDMEEILIDIQAEGFPADDILEKLHDLVVADTTIDDYQKAFIARRLSSGDCQLREGGDEDLQLISVAAYVMRVLTGQPVEYV